jgi:hypothetical protein
MAKTTNLRKKKLESIMTKIAMFTVQETYTDEPEAQALLSNAIQLIEQAAEFLVKSDEAHEKDPAN